MKAVYRHQQATEVERLEYQLWWRKQNLGRFNMERAARLRALELRRKRKQDGVKTTQEKWVEALEAQRLSSLIKWNGHVILYSEPIGPQLPTNFHLKKQKWWRIAEMVAAKHKIESVDELAGVSRRKNFARARFELFYLLRVHKGWSYPEIGRKLNGRDHTTVLHGIRKHCELHGLEYPRVVK